jgi:GNAT superfamily N-acetyltransferase
MAVEIRSAADGDLDALVAVLGQRHYFSEHLARQRDGHGVLLVAWVAGGPVGDLFLAWPPADQPPIREQLPGVPQLTHLEVLDPVRRRGVGTALIRAAEDVARGFGHDRIGLAVGLDNRNARRLYERLGYVDWGHGTVVVSWVERDHHGPPVRSSEICDVLVKRL